MSAALRMNETALGARDNGNDVLPARFNQDHRNPGRLRNDADPAAVHAVFTQ
jgi:hypothetical protein